MSTAAHKLKASLLRGIHFFTNDLKALSEDARKKSAGGCARTPYDVTYEVAVVYEFWNNTLKGGENPPFEGFGDWMKAPEEYQNLDAALEKLTTAGNALAETIGNLSDAELDVEVNMGPMTMTKFDLGVIASGHTMYHGGQLCFIQTLHNDAEMHWMSA